MAQVATSLKLQAPPPELEREPLVRNQHGPGWISDRIAGVIEGKTPEITIDQARALMASINTSTAVGLRDRAIIGVLIYTAARAGH